MARFAKDIMEMMTDLCQRLEVILGPDTGKLSLVKNLLCVTCNRKFLNLSCIYIGDLCLRVGLHSGAVTAGVLRGEKSRFQLFGDTVNTGTVMLAAYFCRAQ